MLHPITHFSFRRSHTSFDHFGSPVVEPADSERRQPLNANRPGFALIVSTSPAPSANTHDLSTAESNETRFAARNLESHRCTKGAAPALRRRTLL
jgi:hypothetical protein